MRRAGFTFIELLLALALAGIVVIGLSTLLKNSLTDYAVQTSLSDLRHNSHATIKRLTEIFMEAGADLPATGAPIIRCNGTQEVSMMVNSRRGIETINASLGATQDLPVTDGPSFRFSDSILIVFADASKGIGRCAIDGSRNTNGFDKGIKTTGDPDTIALRPHTISFSTGDVVYPFSVHRYFLYKDRVCLNDTVNVIAEQIDTFLVTFKTRSGITTTIWDSMYSATLYLNTRSEMPVLKPGSSDRYRRLALSMDFRLRNRM